MWWFIQRQKKSDTKQVSGELSGIVNKMVLKGSGLSKFKYRVTQICHDEQLKI